MATKKILTDLDLQGKIDATGTVLGSNLSGTNTGDQTTITGNAGSANYLIEKSTIAYGSPLIQWTDVSGTGGTGLNGAAPSNPTSDWYHHIVMNHANSTGYYFDLACPFHNDDVYFRRNVGGTLTSWRKVWNDGNLTNVSQLTNDAGYTGDQTTITGNAGSATVLQTARNINGVSFNGSADITVTANANLAGNLLTAVPAGAVFTDTVYTLPFATSTVRGGIELFSNTDNPTAANTVTSTASRTYGIQLNAANQAVVNVPWSNTNTTYVSSDFTHDDLTGFVAAEHIDWALTNAANIHADNYIDTNTTYVSSDFTHNSLTGVTANEHLDWTVDLGATNIHANNYTNTVYSLPQATTTVRGGIEIFSNTDQAVAANTVSSTASRTYGIQLNAANQAVVNVPWVDTDTDTVYTHPSGDGNLHVIATSTTNNGKVLTAGATAGSLTWTDKTVNTNTTYVSSDFTHDDLTGFVGNEHIDWTADQGATNIHANNYINTVYSLPLATNTVRGGIELFSNTDQTVAANTVTTTASRTYGVQLNAANQAVVNVPWADTNTVYTLPEATATVRGGIELFSNTDQAVAATAVSATASRTYGLQLNAAGQGVINVPWVNTNTTYVSSDFTHDNLTGFVANEHIDWTADQGATNIHAGNYTDTNTTYVSSDFTHDSLTGFVANEHIDWTTDQGATNIHSGNYTDTNTTYTGGTGLTLTGTDLTLNMSTSLANANYGVVFNIAGELNTDQSNGILFNPSTNVLSVAGSVTSAGVTLTGDQDLSTYLTDASVQSKYLRSDQDDTSSGQITARRFYIGSVTATTQWAFQARNSASTADSGIYFDTGHGNILLRDSSNNLNIRLRAGGGDSYFLGDLAIGADNAASGIGSSRILRVASTGNSEVNVDHTDAGVSSDIGLYSFSRGGDHLAHMKATCDGATNSAFMSFHTQPAGGSFANAAANERMRITSTGNFGFGTTTPDLKVDIVSGTNNGIRISATDTTSNWRDLSIRSYTSEAEANALPVGSHIFTTNPTSATETAFSKFGGLVIQCRDDGNSSFAIRLGNGAGHSTMMFMGSTGATTFSNTVTATDFILSSDIRLKKDFSPLSSKKLSPKRWTWKESGKKDFGFIAQELEVDFPEVVITGEDGFKRVAYNKITAINSARINELEDEVSELKRKLELIIQKLEM